MINHLIKDLQKLEEVTWRIHTIIKSLRNFSRDGEQDEMVVASLDQIISETLDLCQERMKSKNIRPILHNVEPLDINCRPVQISQVFVNLISNSIDAISEQESPWIEISTKRLKDNYVEISFVDSGGGIPEKIRNRILQPFFTTKEVGEGTGLGLSISVGIIQAHGGTLELDSDHPHTRFVITLPLS